MGTRSPKGTESGRRARAVASGQSRPSPGDRRHFLLPALLALYVVLSILLFDPKLETGGDNAHYLILGQSLAEGKGYRDLHLPGAPVHTQYPPGFPVILAGITLLCGGINVLAAKFFVVLTGIGAMFFIYRLCQLTFGKRAWLVMALFASLPALVVNNHWILTDVPFLFITVAALFCLVLADHRPGATAARLQIGACVLAVASCFIRTAGLANVLGMVMLFLVRRQYRNFIILLSLFALTAVPWQIINARAGHGQPYLEQLLAKHPYFLDRGRAGISDLALRVWKNLQAYATKVVPRMLFLTRVNSRYEAFSGIILSLLAALGFLLSFRKPAPSAPAWRVGALQSCALFAAPILLCWPDLWANERLLLPFLPLVVIFLFSAVDWFGARLGWRWFAPAFVGVLVLANAVQMTSLARKAVSDNLGYLRGDRYSGYDMDWRHYFETIAWIKTHTPADAVVMARKPEFVYLLSGRRSFCYPMTQDGAQIKSAILRSQYVLFDNFSWTAMTSSVLVPTLRDNLGLWKRVFATPPPEFYVLGINPGVQAGTVGQGPAEDKHE